MLPHTEHVQPHLLRELGLLHEVAHPSLGADHVTVVRILLQLRERVDPDLHGSGVDRASCRGSAG